MAADAPNHAAKNRDGTIFSPYLRVRISQLQLPASSEPWLSGYDGDCFHLDHELWTKQRGHLDDRARRRMAGIDVAIPHRAVIRQFRHIYQIYIQFDNVADAASRGLDGGLQVLEGLLSLCAEIGIADELTARIQSDLSGDEQQRARLDLRDVRIAARLVQGFWRQP